MQLRPCSTPTARTSLPWLASAAVMHGRASSGTSFASAAQASAAGMVSPVSTTRCRMRANARAQASAETLLLARNTDQRQAGLQLLLEIGGTLPAVLNAANEVAVEAFVNRKISFPQITETVRRTMDAHQIVSHPKLEQILQADAWARREALKR